MSAKILVRDYMARRLTTLKPDTEIVHAVHVLVTKDISGAPVVDDEGRLVGIVTERDCLKVVLNATYYSEYGGTVSEIMSTDLEVLAPDDGIVEVAKRFIEQRYHRYPVLEEGRLIGQISRRDVMRALADAWQ